MKAGDGLIKTRCIVFFYILVTIAIFAQTITTNEILQDAGFLYQKMKDIHPNIFHTFSEIEAEKDFSKLISFISTKQTWELRDIFRMFAQFVARFKDGHTYVSITDQFSEYLMNGGKVVPIFVSFDDEQITILTDVEGKLNQPGKLISLNGVSAGDLKEEILKMVSFERASFGYARASLLFHLYCWVIFGEQESFTVEFLTQQGQLQKIELESVDFEKYRAKREQMNMSGKLWDFSIIDKTAVMTINTFSSAYEKDLKQFIKQSFEQIKKEDIQNLIIDLRKNGGGSSEIGEYLYSFISNKPYRVYAEIHVKYSDDAVKTLKIFDPLLLFRVKVLNQKIIVHRNDFKKVRRNDLLFNKNVYVLVGPGTFSAAADFAAMVKDLKAATVVGEETGGLASSYGDVLSFILPNSKLQLGVSFKYFVRCGGFDDKRGVIPDIAVQIPITDDTDQLVRTVLEAVKNTQSAKN